MVIHFFFLKGGLNFCLFEFIFCYVFCVLVAVVVVVMVMAGGWGEGRRDGGGD